jgi:hypothetical protein
MTLTERTALSLFPPECGAEPMTGFEYLAPYLAAKLTKAERQIDRS